VRWEKAHQIAQITGMPSKLCFQFLEVVDRNAVDMAAEFVMTYGMKHIAGLEKDTTEETKTNGGSSGSGGSRRRRDLISDDQCKGVDDTAPLSDMGYSDRDIQVSSEYTRGETKTIFAGDDKDAQQHNQSKARENGNERRAAFRELCRILVGAEAHSSFLRVSALPMETVVLSDEKVVSYDSLLSGQRVVVVEHGTPVLQGTVVLSGTGSITASVVNIHTGVSYEIELFPEHQEIWAISKLCGRSVTSLEDIRAACVSTTRALTSYYTRKALVSLSVAGKGGSSGSSSTGGSVSLSNMSIPSDPALKTMREMAHMLYDDTKHTTRTLSAQAYLTLLKVSAASENIFIRDANRFPEVVETPVTDMLREKLKLLIRRQELAGDHNLSKVLIDECIANLNDSTTPGPGTHASTRDSLHPVFPRCNYKDSVFMEGAKMLWVLFDPRCKTKHGAVLSFYHGSDQQCRQPPIAQFTGTNFMPFVVPGNCVNFTFVSNRSVSDAYDDDGSDNGCGWGYRFQVRPLRGLSWVSESQIQAPSLEWACWLLEFLLNEVSELGTGTVHNKKVFNAMVAYLRAKGTPYKHRIIALLTQMLRSPEKFLKDQVPNTKALRGIETAVFSFCRAHQVRAAQRGSGRNGGGSRQTGGLPRRVMQLIEMSITARVSASDFDCIARGVLPKVYGAVNPSDDDNTPLQPVPEPMLSPHNTQNTLGGDGAGEDLRDEGAVLIDVVKTTEALYGRTRLPDECMNHAILIGHGVELKDTKVLMKTVVGGTHDGPEMRTHDLLTVPLMRRSIRNNAWWTSEADLQLVEYVTRLGRNTNTSPSNINPSTLFLSAEEKKLRAKVVANSSNSNSNGAELFLKGLSKFFVGGSGKKQRTLDKVVLEELSPYPLLLSEYHRQHGNGITFRIRFAIIQRWNVQLQIVVRMIDLLDTSASWSLGYKVNRLTDKIFLEGKLRLLDRAVKETTAPGQSNVRITLDNNKAFASQNRAERFARDRDPSVSECLFVQLCRELQHQPSTSFQHALDSKGT
jgi:hypothetical protein